MPFSKQTQCLQVVNALHCAGAKFKDERVDLRTGGEQSFLLKLHHAMWDFTFCKLAAAGHGVTDEQVSDVHIIYS